MLSDRDSRGFTLLEMLAVVAILAILSGTLMSRLGGRGRAKLRLAEELVIRTDAWTRQLVEQQRDGAQLRIDVQAGSLSVETELEGESEFAERRLPTGVTIEQAVSSREDRTRGELVVRFTRDGQSDPYALKLRSTVNEACWIVVSGGTGQVTRYQKSHRTSLTEHNQTRLDDRSIEQFFRTLRRASRADTR
ncbi:MAG: type II secretion system protein [Planctomycetota bacterium]